MRKEKLVRIYVEDKESSIVLEVVQTEGVKDSINLCAGDKTVTFNSDTAMALRRALDDAISESVGRP